MSEKKTPTYHRRHILKPSKYQNPVTFAMTPAALRARKPFFWGNMITAAGLFAVVGGIYNFQDVPIPPISAQELKILKAKREDQLRQLRAAEKKE